MVHVFLGEVNTTMATPDEILLSATLQAVCDELDDAMSKIVHCIDQLSDEQIWWRPSPPMNSIANLVLHLCGNMRQWIIAGVGGAEDTRNRPREFAERGPIDRSELIRHLTATVTEAKTSIVNVSVGNLVAGRVIQGYGVTGIAAVLHSLTHFRGHVQEIIHMTRCQLGDGYRTRDVPP